MERALRSRIFAPLFILVCSLTVSAETGWKTFKAQKPAKGSLIPTELISRIKGSFGDEPLEKAFMSAEVSIFDQHHVIDPPVKVVTPLGGGTVDLSTILPEGRARFSIRIKLMDASDIEVVPDRVYFVPKVSLLAEGKELNCGKYFDVTSFFKSSLGSKEGFETYLTEGLYATNLIGSFVFVKKLPEEKKVLLGNVNFIDRRFSKRSCPATDSGERQ